MRVIYRYMYVFVVFVLAQAPILATAESSSETSPEYWSRADFNALTLACVDAAADQSNAAIIAGLGHQISQQGLEALLLVNREHLLRSCQCLSTRITEQYSPSEAKSQSAKLIELSARLSAPGAVCATDAEEILTQARRRYAADSRSGGAVR